jgi:hypothetical protein
MLILPYTMNRLLTVDGYFVIYFPVHGLPMGALPVDATAGWAFGKMILGEVHVGWDTVLDRFFGAFLEPPVALQTDGERMEAAFIQSQGAEELLYLRLEAVALDEDGFHQAADDDTAFHNPPVAGQQDAVFGQGGGDDRGIVSVRIEAGIKACHAQPLRHFSHIVVDDKFELGAMHQTKDSAFSDAKPYSRAGSSW